MSDTATVEFTEDELNAVGLCLALWRAQDTGVNIVQALTLAAALQSTDSGVMRALIDRVVLKMSVVEEEVFHHTAGLFDEVALRDKRATMSAHLDQVFAEFEEDGRSLYGGDDDL